MNSTYWKITDPRIGREWQSPLLPTIPFPHEVGTGALQLLGMHGGFQFLSYESSLTRSAKLVARDPGVGDSAACLLLVAVFQGSTIIHPGSREETGLVEGKLTLVRILDCPTELSFPTHYQRSFNIGLSHGLIRRLDHEMGLPSLVRRLLNGEVHSISAPIDRRAHTLIAQIIKPQVHGGADSLYREAKAMELLATLLGEWSDSKTSPGHRWRQRDVDRLHEAREQLIARLDAPPSLAELAQWTGMSQTKLKLGFRVLFQTTVSDTLREARMGQARHLMEQGDLPLKAVAAQLGFSDAASLSHAFKAYFGCTPGDVRRRRKMAPDQPSRGAAAPLKQRAE